jgi:acetyl-CoA acetyltransferase
VRPDDLAATAIAARSSAPASRRRDRGRLARLRQPGRRGQPQRRAHGALLAGLPDSVAGVTVNRLCASGSRRGRRLPRGDRRRRRPLRRGRRRVDEPRAARDGEAGQAFPRGNQTVWDTTLGWRFPNPRMEEMFPLESMGETGRERRRALGVSREDQDAFALESQQRWAAADAAGRSPTSSSPSASSTRDEHPRPDTTPRSSPRCKPAFREDGTVTAGNSSGLNDGAAALVIASEERRSELGVEPLGASSRSPVAGVDPRVMGIGPFRRCASCWPRPVSSAATRPRRAERGVRLAEPRRDPRARARPGRRSTSTAARSRSATRSG